MIGRTPVFLVVMALSALSPLSGPVSGQTHDPAAARTLNGHLFIPSSLIRDPFITTMARTQTGAGIANKVTREFEDEAVDSLVGILVGDLAFMALGFEFQYAATDWLALSAAGSGAARLGTGVQSVLAEGISSMFSFSFKAKARILEREKWLLSGTARFEPSTQYRLDILTFVKRAIDEGEIAEDNSVLIASDGMGAAAGLGAAYAPRSWLGLVFNGDIGYADTFSEEGRSDLAWYFGGLASFDLNPLTGTPLGFLMSLSQDSFVVENSDITEKVTGFGLGIAYTGRDDFSVSLESSRLMVPLIDSDETINASIFRFSLSYFF